MAISVTTGEAVDILNYKTTLHGEYEVFGDTVIIHLLFIVGEPDIAWGSNRGEIEPRVTPFEYDTYPYSTLRPNTYYEYRAWLQVYPHGDPPSQEHFGEVGSFTTSHLIVTTQAATDILTAQVTANGTITDKCLPMERGFEYYKDGAPGTLFYKYTTDGQEGAYSKAITGLLAGTKYYIRSYVRLEYWDRTEEEYTYYITTGDWVEFTTLIAIPVVTTQAATQIGYKSAMGNGTIISGGDVTERGFEVKVEVDYFGVGGDIWWGLIGFSDEGDIVYSAGQRTGTLIKRETKTGTFSAGAFAVVLGYADVFGDPSSVFNDALKECTSYTYRAYATNDEGTGHGSWVAFDSLCYPRGHQDDDTLPISDIIPMEIAPAVAPFVPPFDKMRVFMEEFPDFVFPEFEYPVFEYPDVPPYTGSWIGGFYYRKAYTKKDLDELRKKCKVFLDNSVEYALVLNHNMQVLKQYLNDMHDYLGADEYNTFKFLIPTQWLNELTYKPLNVMDFKAIINNFINNSIANASNVNHNFRLIRDGLVAYLASGDVDIGFEPIEVRTKTSKDNNPDVERLKKVIDALSREMANNYMTINHNLRILKATLI